MNLIIDQGNTRSKMAVFQNRQLIELEVRENAVASEFLREWLENKPFDRIIISTTVENSGLIEMLDKTVPHYLLLDEHTKLPFKNNYGTPQSLGKDRLAAVAGAYALHPGKACLVIDAGTAITYDYLDENGTYQGGSITPGIKMRTKAMHQFTSRLPEVEVGSDCNLPGKNTITSLQTGAYWGTVYEMEGFIRFYEQKASSLLVFLTGGDALLFDKNIKNSIFVSQNLVLLGLNSLLEYNAH